jgi:hypothetical protein
MLVFWLGEHLQRAGESNVAVVRLVRARDSTRNRQGRHAGLTLLLVTLV